MSLFDKNGRETHTKYIISPKVYPPCPVSRFSSRLAPTDRTDHLALETSPDKVFLETLQNVR